MGALPSFKAPLFGSGVLTASFADRPPVLGRKGARGKEGLEEGKGRNGERGSFKVLVVLQANTCWRPPRLWDIAHERISGIGLKTQIFI